MSPHLPLCAATGGWRALRFALVLIALCARPAWTNAQNASQKAENTAPPALVACPQPAEVMPGHLFGLWRAEFEGLPGATLLLEKHPDYDDSVSGGINRNGDKAQLAGDADEGVFTLEESVDGSTISATWNGYVVNGSCGKEIRGTWKNVPNNRETPFILRKLPG